MDVMVGCCLYMILKFTKNENEKFQELTDVLFKLVSENDIKNATQNLKIKENRHVYLNEQSTRFLASAEHISKKL